MNEIKYILNHLGLLFEHNDIELTIKGPKHITACLWAYDWNTEPISIVETLLESLYQDLLDSNYKRRNT